MAIVYVPDEMADEVKLMKLYRRQGRKYYIILDFKEESRNEEKLPPCTPFIKEEKKKEERGERGTQERGAEGVGGGKGSFPVYLDPPGFEEVEAFFEAGDFKMLTAREFYDRCTQRKWVLPKGPILDWKASALGMEAYRLQHNWKPAPAVPSASAASQPEAETYAEKRQRLLLSAETRMQDEAERQTAERNARLKKQQEMSCSYEAFLRMKKEGYFDQCEWKP